ncbi:MBOAT family O-acyltransferase [Endothiovibrio diazotrophicus]
MLFNSPLFIFLFLPLALWDFFKIGGRGHHRVATAWLVGASLAFYGWWNPAYLGLILGSILFNYALGVQLGSSRGTPSGRWALIGGVAANLGLLGYYKYANFFIDNLDALGGFGLHLDPIALPLAISFFTFQQIAYLMDAWRGETREYNFLHYCLFVTFFPQLIAGPIVHHKEMLPQFARDAIYRVNAENLAVGATLFTIGLFKKVVIADRLAEYATPVFDAAAGGALLSAKAAWGGTLAYSLQLYFDFSGYSDMALGLARLFGIRLPLNFHSPYQAVNIIDFWRRWHMTLSRFLRDYLYIPLGGNRRGPTRRQLNLMATMLLGGLWHGAGWTFVVWGGLHGLYLMINHGWHALRRALGQDPTRSTLAGRWLSRALTLLAVMVAWVFFRAADLDTALAILHSLAGLTDGTADGLKAARRLPQMLLILSLTLWAPNTQQIMARFNPAFDTYRFASTRDAGPRWWQWRLGWPWLLATTTLAVLATLHLTRVSEFLYFRF